MAALKEITQLNGLTMKQLARLTGIKYTTLATTAKKPITTWSSEVKAQVAGALKMDVSAFEQAMSDQVLSPFIKWVGGKRQLLPSLVSYLPKNYRTYYEPFVGGGALLLRLAPNHAVINDFNGELTNTYQQVKDHLPELSERLKQHQYQDSKDYYLDLRSVDRDGRIVSMSAVDRAARFIYLNKAGYNGLWRVNSKGQNNVPYGSHKSLNLVTKSLKTDSEYFQKADVKILTGDYAAAVKDVVAGDLVYFDPPYIPVKPTANFTTYTKAGFGLIQQEQLRDLAKELTEKSVSVMLSNADVALTRELYADPIFHLHEIQAMRYINSKANGRGKVGELIITNY
ncbi:DNA adenine methylase [Lactiplantibacillus plantarum]